VARMVGSEVLAIGALSLVMFIASFSAGTVPLAMTLSNERMKLISALGVGLLVGTSLGVVLPEGIEMLYTSSETHTNHRLLKRQEHALPNAVSHGASHHEERSFHTAIALSLVAGYLVMHLLTFMPPLLFARDEEAPIPLSSLPSSPTLERVPSGGHMAHPPSGMAKTTVGLCIHALADGIALGSSAVSNKLGLEGIVFFAIMLHKVKALERLPS